MPCPEVSPFRPIEGEWRGSGDRVIQAAAGNTFSIVLTASGKGSFLLLSNHLIADLHPQSMHSVVERRANLAMAALANTS